MHVRKIKQKEYYTKPEYILYILHFIGWYKNTDKEFDLVFFCDSLTVE